MKKKYMDMSTFEIHKKIRDDGTEHILKNWANK